MKKNSLDKFYTKKNTVERILSNMNLDEYDVIVEPSAGNGSFSKEIPNCIAYDIEPEDEEIIKADFLKLESVPKGNNVLFIGNPPFGRRCSLAKAFIKKSIDLGANTIAFILPDVFLKFGTQKVFPTDWSLSKISPLEDTTFYVNDDEDYYVPCSFFIWINKDVKTDLRKIKQEQSSDFSFLSRGDKNADFVINGNSCKVREVSEVSNSKAEHYIKSNIDKLELKEIFSNLNFQPYSSVNGGISWIGREEILEAYNEFKKEQKII